eukprot:scaffold36224_cov36-Tisochrysis_lutea.AAC.4
MCAPYSAQSRRKGSVLMRTIGANTHAPQYCHTPSSSLGAAIEQSHGADGRRRRAEGHLSVLSSPSLKSCRPHL